MDIPTIDYEKCSSCGLCAEVCGMDVIVTGEDGPRINAGADCHVCGHCVAVCPRDAVTLGDMVMERTVPAGETVSSEGMKALLYTKRSIRHFTDREIEEPILRELIDAARMAPTAINCQERASIVVRDGVVMADIRKAILGYIKRVRFLLKIVTARPLSWMMPKAPVNHLSHLLRDFDSAIKHTEAGEDYIFHNAPCLILFTGIAADPFGKDHALGAMHYLMLYAQSLGLGTCINGYVQSAPKLVARYVDVPQKHRIYGAVIIGYPAHRFVKTVYRKAPCAVFV